MAEDPSAVEELLSLESTVMQAIAAKDRVALRPLLAESGGVVTSRGAFTDVFTRVEGRWRLALAFSVELPGDAA
jgi:hypothetical protein